ncbi:LOW QUALITY PROTEIN: interferon-induced very large GTPase 1-like [Puntigrus tetrazona]|uniref:LOW QUALITY PROTEIN: interferon-induced very large GTPase 1-like n=1 Tax=Puntigrus tetrazona TaxID=1606681 RepID=UPI001C8AFAFA|nr:LOW QUALITY PROTEIN: interferon-induced very large GTPase 1-like [Puntigrus tetrazona]
MTLKTHPSKQPNYQRLKEEMDGRDENSGIHNVGKQEETDGHIRFTDVGPHSVRLEWGDPDMTANAQQKFQIRWKNEDTDFTKTTDTNHFEIKQLLPGTRYDITVVAMEENSEKSLCASVCTAIPAPENFEYVSEDAKTIRLYWKSPRKMDPSLYRFQVIMFKNEEETQSATVKSDVNTAVIDDLLPATEYKAIIKTMLNNLKLSKPAVLIVHTKPPPPENLQIKNEASSVCLKWADPIIDKNPHRFRVIWSSETNAMESLTDKAEMNVSGLKPGTEYYFSVRTLVELNGTKLESCPVKITHRTNINMESVLMELGLQSHLKNKLTLKLVLELRRLSDEGETGHSFTSLPWLFLRKLMMLNSSARRFKCASKSKSETSIGINIIKTSEDKKGINPLDLITGLFHCADPFLQQEMALKMSVCQFAVPLLLPNCDTKESTLMLWALRDITKQFRLHGLEENSIVLTDLPLISFVRLGKNCVSKSEFLNKLLSSKQQNYDTFFHWKLASGNFPRKISNGLVEISWSLPSGRETIDKFKEPVAVANLRGDVSEFDVQFAFLSQTSSAVFLFCDDLDSNQTFLNSLQLRSKLVLVCTTKDQKSQRNLEQNLAVLKLKTDSVILKHENMNDDEFVDTLQKAVVKTLADSSKISIEKMSKIAPDLGIDVDENDAICQNAKIKADKITKDIGNIPEYKMRELPLQGKPLKELSKMEKEMCRLRKAQKKSIEQYKSELKSQIHNLKMEQGRNNMREAVVHFISGLCCSSNEQLYFLKWMKMNLDKLTRKHISMLDKQYRELCRNPTEDKEHLRDLDNQFANSSLGVQHFMRELSQLYESAHFQKTWNHLHLQKLPEICAQLMLNGFPLELIDGDASNIPLTWIGDVLAALNKLTSPHNKIRVVTVLGVQSSGKSTLLNTMFGVQFAVSSGRCTRGAFMLLIGVSEEFRSELKCDYILVIDTEGLKSLELAKLDDSYEHDNELATLVVGLSDITIINIAMENATEMKDTLQIVVHAFLRMKEVGKKPCCHFAHQNTADVAVQDKILRERISFFQQLDDMTNAAAKMEKKSNNYKFTDILEYDINKNNWYIPGLWLGTPPMAPVNTGYSEEVSNFKDGMLNVLRKTKFPAQDFMEFAEWIRSLWKAVQFENFIFSFRNSLVAEAYSKLCAEFNTWEWAFKKHMIDWYTKSETKISNMGVMSVQSESAVNLDRVLAALNCEADNELEKEEKNLLDTIQQYFENELEHAHLVENHKEDFLNSARGLRREVEMDIRIKLENAILIQKGIEKVEHIKQEQRDTMRDKVLSLIQVCRSRTNTLSESELNEEFEKIWNDILKDNYFTALPKQDVVKETYRLLYNNLEMKSGAVREMLSKVTSLDQCGTGKFFAIMKMNIFQKIRGSLRPAERSKKHKLMQLACDKIIHQSETFIANKTEPKSDYNSADIQELLCSIDKNLESCSESEINPEVEAALKIHICGIAARAFQKMHDDYIQRNDPLKSLENFKEEWLADFKDLYYQRDQCQNKAETCMNKCFGPAVMEYIKKRLGPDIVDEMLSGETGLDFGTRSFFQFSLLKKLLWEDNFSNILEYVQNYEAYVTAWISEKIVEHFSKKGALSKLEIKHLNVIINKLKEAVDSAQSKADVCSGIGSFVTYVCRRLNKELVIPSDTLKASLALNNSNPAEFIDCFKSSIEKMHKRLEERLREEKNVKQKLTGLSVSNPQQVLFSRVFGCGKKCPFCSAPCEAGGKKHAMHFVSIHRPQGIGCYSWVQTDKLVPDICSSLVASEMTFRHKDTGFQWHPNKEYRQIYPDWLIQPDTTIEATDFWKYIFAKYNKAFAEKYRLKPADIPADWYWISVHQANKCLEDTFKMRRS